MLIIVIFNQFLLEPIAFLHKLLSLYIRGSQITVIYCNTVILFANFSYLRDTFAISNNNM